MASVICKTPHTTPAGRTRKGDVLDDKDSRVKANPQFFASPDDMAPVERATAGPGERRAVRRRSTADE